MKKLVSLALQQFLHFLLLPVAAVILQHPQQSPLLKALMRLHLQTEPSRSAESDRSPVEQQFMARLL